VNVSNALIDYDVLMREAVTYASSTECWSFISPALQKSALIFDIRLVFDIREQARKFINDTDKISFPSDVKLFTYNETVIKEYINLQRYAQLTDQVKLYYTKQAIEKNRVLDSLIRTEYHIK
jgi:plasmid maintenance system antidote protein VapI